MAETYRIIPLTQGKVAIVDAEDYEELATYKWQAIPTKYTWYARRRSSESDGPKHIYMHRQILGLAPGAPMADHRNRNGLDNRRKNLRTCTPTQNGRNGRDGFYRGTSRYKGVYWNRAACKWHAQISIMKHVTYLGHFTNEADAARAYDAAARRESGEFACTNFPMP